MTQETIFSERQQQGVVKAQVFNNQQFGELRVAGTVEAPLFCLADVCRALGLTNVSKAKSRLEEKGVTQSYTLTNGGKQLLTFVDEPNLYRCIFRSDKDEAKVFQDWVFNEVLPSIRKTGGYIATKQDDTPETIMARAVLVAQDTITKQKERIESLQRQNKQITAQNEAQAEEISKLTPDAEYTRTVLTSTSTYTTTQIAKEYGMGAVTFNKTLSRLRIQYKVRGQWMLYEKYQDKGYTVSTTVNFIQSDGTVGPRMQTEWTEAGRQFLHQLHDEHWF